MLIVAQKTIWQMTSGSRPVYILLGQSGKLEAGELMGGAGKVMENDKTVSKIENQAEWMYERLSDQERFMTSATL